MQSITQPTTVAYRPAAMATLAAILLSAGFAGGMLVTSAPFGIAPAAVHVPTTVQPEAGLLEFRHGEWSVGSVQAPDQGLLDQRRGEIGVGTTPTKVEDQGLLDQRRGEIGVGSSSAEAALRLQRRGEFTAN
jgi:hypothetical protein